MPGFARISAVLFALLPQLAMLDASSLNSPVRQKRAWIVDSFTIEEEHPGPFPYPLGNIHIYRDYFVKFVLHGKGVDEDPKNILKIDPTTGLITVHGKVDYEEYNVLRLTFEARKASMDLDTNLFVEINILDINDHPPKFQKNVYETTIEESLTQGSNAVTILATDYDKPGTPNSTVEYKIISVNPNLPSIEFYIEQSGTISFKGCLDYEKAKKYTILVEAKDKGEVVRLSSSCTVIINVLDKNNHLPTFTGHTGPGRVNERESGISVMRVHVTDRDSKNTPAWRAKYTIEGDHDGTFSIHTDPDTNDGILTVEKPLDYELVTSRNLTISVENEEPFFSCEVKKSDTGLWQVLTTGSATGQGDILRPSTEHVTVLVDDVNDPPTFKTAVKNIWVEENLEAGRLLETLTAIDLDRTHNNEFVYKIANDIDHWVTVDAKTGQIRTLKILDRESPYVVDNTYNITLYAIDKGQPPMTGTGMFIIHLKDQNDNVPELLENALDMCLSDGPTAVQIAAHDRDEEPFAGPYLFELLGDVKGRWHLDPYHDILDFERRYPGAYNGNLMGDYIWGLIRMTAKLVKEKTVYAGPHDLQLRIFDAQGHASLQYLSVTVCDCSVSPNCRTQRSTGSRVTTSAAGIMFIALLALLGLLLLAVFVSCKKEVLGIPLDQGTGEYLLASNIETRGTDCQIPSGFTEMQKDEVDEIVNSKYVALPESTVQPSSKACSDTFDEGRTMYQHRWGTSLHRSPSNKSHMRRGYHQALMLRRSYSTCRRSSLTIRDKNLRSFLNERIYFIKAGEELLDYHPKIYSYEGDSVTDPQLDNISITESEFNLDRLQDLGPRFYDLAAVCRPDLDFKPGFQ